MTAWAGAQRRPRYGPKIDPALKERWNIWVIEGCPPSILVALSELDRFGTLMFYDSTLSNPIFHFFLGKRFCHRAHLDFNDPRARRLFAG
jgi:hypothetical protein